MLTIFQAVMLFVASFSGLSVISKTENETKTRKGYLELLAVSGVLFILAAFARGAIEYIG